jgi:hypothetical protein
MSDPIPWVIAPHPPEAHQIQLLNGIHTIPVAVNTLVKAQDLKLWNTQVQAVLASLNAPSTPDSTASKTRVKWFTTKDKVMTTAFNMASTQDGKIVKKGAWKLTSFYDSKLRAFIAKLVFGYLPVRVRQCAWYPEVYHRPTDALCPRCEKEEESALHFLQCSSKLATGELQDSLRPILNKLASPDSPFQLDSNLPATLMEIPCLQDLRYGLPISWFRVTTSRFKISEYPTNKRPSKTNWLATSLRAFYQALYNSCWRSRNDLSISEESTHGCPHHNRRLMRMSKALRVSKAAKIGPRRDDGIPKPPPPLTPTAIQASNTDYVKTLISPPMV